MRTVSDLSDKLAEERIWRVKEITAVRSLAIRPDLGPVEQGFYCRAGATLFYSHWEGFVKRAALHYVKFIAYQRVPLASMADFLLSMYMAQVVRSTPEKITQAADKLLRLQSFQPSIAWKNVVSTDSNLSSSVIKRINDQLGLDNSFFALKTFVIDKNLLSHRNAIAHGDKGEVDVAMLDDLATQVIALITAFRDLIENAAVLKAYQR